MQMGAYQIRGGMSRRKEDLKGGMLNEQGWGGTQASFSRVMKLYLGKVQDLAMAVVVEFFLKSPTQIFD